MSCVDILVKLSITVRILVCTCAGLQKLKRALEEEQVRKVESRRSEAVSGQKERGETANDQQQQEVEGNNIASCL